MTDHPDLSTLCGHCSIQESRRGFNCSERGETAHGRQAQTRTVKKRKADRMSQINFTSTRTSLTPLNSD